MEFILITYLLFVVCIVSGIIRVPFILQLLMTEYEHLKKMTKGLLQLTMEKQARVDKREDDPCRLTWSNAFEQPCGHPLSEREIERYLSRYMNSTQGASCKPIYGNGKIDEVINDQAKEDKAPIPPGTNNDIPSDIQVPQQSANEISTGNEKEEDFSRELENEKEIEKAGQNPREHGDSVVFDDTHSKEVDSSHQTCVARFKDDDKGGVPWKENDSHVYDVYWGPHSEDQVVYMYKPFMENFTETEYEDNGDQVDGNGCSYIVLYPDGVEGKEKVKDDVEGEESESKLQCVDIDTMYDANEDRADDYKARRNKADVAKYCTFEMKRRLFEQYLKCPNENTFTTAKGMEIKYPQYIRDNCRYATEIGRLNYELDYKWLFQIVPGHVTSSLFVYYTNNNDQNGSARRPQRHPPAGMQNEWARFVSFFQYTGRGNTFRLARHGWYHDPELGATLTVCVFCFGVCFNWEPGDSVRDRHPDCPLYSGRTDNVPIHPGNNPANDDDSQASRAIAAVRPSEEANGEATGINSAASGRPREGTNGAASINNSVATGRPRREANGAASMNNSVVTGRPRREANGAASMNNSVVTGRPRGEANGAASMNNSVATGRPRGEANMAANSSLRGQPNGINTGATSTGAACSLFGVQRRSSDDGHHPTISAEGSSNRHASDGARGDQDGAQNSNGPLNRRGHDGNRFGCQALRRQREQGYQQRGPGRCVSAAQGPVVDLRRGVVELHPRMYPYIPTGVLAMMQAQAFIPVNRNALAWPNLDMPIMRRCQRCREIFVILPCGHLACKTCQMTCMYC